MVSPTKFLNMTRLDLPRLIDGLGICHGVEIGVAQGWFSQWLLSHSRLESLWLVDPYPSGPFRVDQGDAVMHTRQYGDRVVPHWVSSVEAANLAAREGRRFGFIYIDGNHRKVCVEQDIEAWLPLCDSPCIFAGHDYLDRHRNDLGVIPVVHALARRLRMPLFLTGEDVATWFFILGTKVRI